MYVYSLRGRLLRTPKHEVRGLPWVTMGCHGYDILRVGGPIGPFPAPPSPNASSLSPRARIFRYVTHSSSGYSLIGQRSAHLSCDVVLVHTYKPCNSVIPYYLSLSPGEKEEDSKAPVCPRPCPRIKLWLFLFILILIFRLLNTRQTYYRICHWKKKSIGLSISTSRPNVPTPILVKYIVHKYSTKFQKVDFRNPPDYCGRFNPPVALTAVWVQLKPKPKLLSVTHG